MSWLRRLSRALALAPFVVIVGACGGPNFTDICDKSESCSGGNDKDKQACVDAANTDQELAEDVGCQTEFNDYVTCVTGASSCRSVAAGPCNTTADCAKQSGGTCSNQQCQVSAFGMDPKNKSCDAPKNAYQSCVK